MPSITGYNPPKWRDRKAASRDVDNPDGVFSGMTLGLAKDGDGHVSVTNMPPDSRNIGPLPDENPHYD